MRGQLAFLFQNSSTGTEPSPVATPATNCTAVGSQSSATSAAKPVIIDAAPGVSLDIQRSAQHLTQELALLFGEPLRIVITDNRRTMISGGRKGGRLELRLHRMFLAAPPPILGALVRYLRDRDRRAGRMLDHFIADNRSEIRHRKRRIRIRTQGEVHDLAAMFADLESRFFEGNLQGVRITWGRRSTRQKQRSIRLGTYALAEQLIRIHPVLDNTWVPAFYVESVIYHEMLHHVLPPERGATRTSFHTPEFRRRERLFPRSAEAARWEKEYLDRLLANASC